MRRLAMAVVFGLLAAFVPRAHAEISSSSPAGFRVKSEAVVAVSTDSLYRTLVNHVAAWWDPDHTFSGDAANMSIDARPGGCFCEALPDGGGVRHMQVVYVAPGKLLRMAGALGPLQGSGLAGSLTWSFEAQGDSTRVAMQYSVGGYMEGDLEQIAPIVDGVLQGQLLRLKAFAETGEPKPR
jgi:hypothetical protein